MLIRRSPLGRSFGAVLALWLAVFQAEPAALHVCAMHSGHGIAATAASAAVSGGATTAAAQTAAHNHAQHLAVATEAVAVPEHAPAAPHDSGAQCTCPGGCCAATSVAMPNGANEFVIEVAVPASRPSSAIVSVLVAAADFVLPFANGPPAQV